MSPNKLTPDSNIMWESSRMMLPEHKEVLRKHHQQQDKREKPIIEEQQLAMFSVDITFAYTQQLPIRIETFDPYQEVCHIGKIKKIDSYQQKVQLTANEEIYWIAIADVLNVTVL
ncbi:hypothetical protein Pryu01_02803 [Paraliobacillus ryukyuensis]|uniref:YolD-like protein n=1 Tax=Paraliobacillus ryukyuensis TaxID=200904 RepID=A0A366E8P5_9BACI|nr:YolD-like family protein [Paraliobacillus ryukyuensis]RBO98129.1 YolD-like protein [Paraliobacillus ryukyuensis]